MLSDPSADAARAEWLSAERLGQAKIAPGVRSCMIGKGLLTARAFLGADIKPSCLWARRYRFTLHGAPLLVQELFLPAVGQV